MTKDLAISAITRDPALQTRAQIRPEVVEEYAALMREGVEFPPLDVYQDGPEYVLADGWHRIMAAESLGLKRIPCDIHEGGRKGALLHAVRSNQSHGLRRSNEDKRRCVQLALAGFPDKSSRDIAELCGVSNSTVEIVRKQLCDSNSCQQPRVGKDGKTRKLPTRPTAAPQPTQDAPEPEAPHIQTADEERPACARCGEHRGNMFAGLCGDCRDSEANSLDSSSAATTAATGTGSAQSDLTDDSGADPADFDKQIETDIWMRQMAVLNHARKYGKPGMACLLGLLPKAGQLLTNWSTR